MEIEWVDRVKSIRSPRLRRRVFEWIYTFFVPFSHGLGLRIRELDDKHIVIDSPDRRRRRNHIGGAHGCAQALMAEHAAGILLMQQFPPDRFRLVVSSLSIEYQQQGRGPLVATTHFPAEPVRFDDGKGSIVMSSVIRDAEDRTVSQCQTSWQIKQWSDVRTPRPD